MCLRVVAIATFIDQVGLTRLIKVRERWGYSRALLQLAEANFSGLEQNSLTMAIIERILLEFNMYDSSDSIGGVSLHTIGILKPKNIFHCARFARFQILQPLFNSTKATRNHFEGMTLEEPFLQPPAKIPEERRCKVLVTHQSPCIFIDGKHIGALLC